MLQEVLYCYWFPIYLHYDAVHFVDMVFNYELVYEGIV